MNHEEEQPGKAKLTEGFLSLLELEDEEGPLFERTTPEDFPCDVRGLHFADGLIRTIPPEPHGEHETLTPREFVRHYPGGILLRV